jgi:hypothetical protein
LPLRDQCVDVASFELYGVELFVAEIGELIGDETEDTGTVGPGGVAAIAVALAKAFEFIVGRVSQVNSSMPRNWRWIRRTASSCD